MTYLLALDQGTSSSRAIVLDAASGNIVASAQREFRQIFPQPGWVEHDPEEIWQSQLATARQALAKAGLSGEQVGAQVKAIGITNQRETTVVWNRRTGQAIHNAIVWQDRRTEPLCEQLRAAGHAEQIRQSTGLVVDPYFSGTKLRWLLDHVSGAHIAAAHGDLAFGTIDSWLLYKLTGGRVHATDVSNASRTMLFDVRHNVWDHELLKLLKIPDSLLPKVHASSHLFGESDAALLGAALPIAGIAGDQQSALFGQACFKPGLAKNTYGTGCFMLMNTGEKPFPSTSGLLTTLAYKLGDAPAVYALEGSIPIAGALVQWLRDNLGFISNAAEIEPLAASVSDNGDVYCVPAFSGLYAPHWDDSARGIIAGLTRFATKAHIARAALEAVAYQVREVVEAMAHDSGVTLTELRVDGGMVVNELLMQFQADILGVPVVRPKVIETTALGAAYAAGLAVGYWQSTAQITANWGIDKRWQPAMEAGRRAELFTKWNKAVERAQGWTD